MCRGAGALRWASALRVELSPGGPLFKLGERQQLLCSVGDCPAAPVISWTPLGDRPLNAAGVRTRDRLSVLTFDPVEMEHEGPLLCRVTCGEQRKYAKTHIRLYGQLTRLHAHTLTHKRAATGLFGPSCKRACDVIASPRCGPAFPSDPEIRGQRPVRAGEESTLTCEVRDLYPAEALTLDWLRGGQVVRSVAGEAGAGAVRAAYTFSPGRGPAGENLTCRATLDLHDLPPEERTRQTVARLHVTCKCGASRR